MSEDRCFRREAYKFVSMCVKWPIMHINFISHSACVYQVTVMKTKTIREASNMTPGMSFGL